MGTLWFCLVALMIALYVLLDGFDLGAGAIHLFVAKTDEERKQVLASIAPVWDGNEVWLLAAGGTLYFAFPLLYASGFSGFYLPLIMVLWLLILRGISIEFRNHIRSAVWDPLWDFVFCASSILLCIFLGAALGNVVRGVPLDSSGYFFEPLWTNFLVDEQPGILDWFTILVGLLALSALLVHGSLWVALKTTAQVQLRSLNVARNAWWFVLLLTIVVTIASFRIQPHIAVRFGECPWGYIFPLFALVALIGVRLVISRSEFKSFLASSCYLAGMLLTAVFGLFPMVLPARNPSFSLTVQNTQAGDYGLKIGIIWWVLGMILVTGYFVYVYRSFAGKVALEKPQSTIE
jgi:cytochrome bd ubiquinol oxidase subunit II